MKTIFNTIILALCSFLVVAQEDITNVVLTDQSTSESVLETTTSKNTKAKKLKEMKKTYSFQHSKLAATQLRLFVAQNTVYPELMHKNKMEGKVILVVNISDSGKIESAKVFRGINAEFDKASLDAVKLMKSIVVNESKYYGNKTIYVPVVFTITDI